MARIRTIKPEFWTDGAVVQLSPYARLFFIGMWNFACDRGHLTDEAMALKLRILPADDVDPEALIEELVTAGRVARIKTEDGRAGLWVRRFVDHQKVDARWQSRCPYCADSTTPPETHRNSPESTGDSPKLPEPRPRSGKERSGKESTSPSGMSRATRATRSRATRSRATRLPDDFTVTDDMVAWASEHTPRADGRSETAKFVDYWRSKSGNSATKLDWVATWRNWMRRANESVPRARASPTGRPTDDPDYWDRQMNRAREREAREA